MIIEQDVFFNLTVEKKSYKETGRHLQINQNSDCLCVTPEAAKQLIKVLQEFANEQHED